MQLHKAAKGRDSAMPSSGALELHKLTTEAARSECECLSMARSSPGLEVRFSLARIIVEMT